jgi:hypothetical protein
MEGEPVMLVLCRHIKATIKGSPESALLFLPPGDGMRDARGGAGLRFRWKV